MNIEACPACGGNVNDREIVDVIQGYMFVMKINCSDCDISRASYDTKTRTITTM